MNKIKPTITDEVTGIEVSNALYEAYQKGIKEGRRQVIEGYVKNLEQIKWRLLIKPSQTLELVEQLLKEME